jgi:hypothetical protein
VSDPVSGAIDAAVPEPAGPEAAGAEPAGWLAAVWLAGAALLPLEQALTATASPARVLSTRILVFMPGCSPPGDGCRQRRPLPPVERRIVRSIAARPTGMVRDSSG